MNKGLGLLSSKLWMVRRKVSGWHKIGFEWLQGAFRAVARQPRWSQLL